MFLLSLGSLLFLMIRCSNPESCRDKRGVGRGCGLVQEEVTWQNSHECWRRMKKIKKSCFSEREDSLHDFPTVGVMSFQAEILLTIHMEIEGSGGADSHINLICP